MKKVGLIKECNINLLQSECGPPVVTGALVVTGVQQELRLRQGASVICIQGLRLRPEGKNQPPF